MAGRFAGRFAGLAVLSADYFSLPESEIKRLESVLTIVGGKPVYPAQEFEPLDPPALPVLPECLPVARFGGYGAPLLYRCTDSVQQPCPAHRHRHLPQHHDGLGACMCWAF